MSLLPTRRRRQIQRKTQYFHALFQADADGDLIVDDDDWQGDLAALREDSTESNQEHALVQQKALEVLNTDLENEMAPLRKKMVGISREFSDDVKKLGNVEKNGLFSGQMAARALRGI